MLTMQLLVKLDNLFQHFEDVICMLMEIMWHTRFVSKNLGI